MRAEGDPQPLNQKVYPCDYPVPESGIVDGYDSLKNATCNYCQEMCDPPDVTSEIKFFDGFNSKLAWIVLGSVAGFSILWQLYVCAARKNVEQEIESRGLNAKMSADKRVFNLAGHSEKLATFNPNGIGNSADTSEVTSLH